MGGETIKEESGGISLADIMNAIKSGGEIFGGKSSTTTGTKNTKFDQAQMDSMLKNILEQTGQYADTAQQSHAVGGYDSSMQALALNDLLTRSAARVAELNTTQTETIQKTEDPLIGKEGITGALGALGVGQLLASGLGGIGGIASAAGGVSSLASGAKSVYNSVFGGDTFSGSSEVLADSTAPGVVTPYNLSEGLGSTAAESGGGFWSGVSDFSTGSPNSTAGNVGQGVGYAMAAYDAYNDLKTDNAGGAVGAGVGAYFGGPLGEKAGQAIGTLADTYVLDPINQNIIQPVGHAFDEAITQNVGKVASKAVDLGKSAVKSVSKAVKKLNPFCFTGDTEIVLADGTTKLMRDIEIGDNLALGGKVLMVGKALCNAVVNYRGTRCSESHFVLENEVWINAGDSELATPAPDELVYPYVSENHCIVASAGFISGDFLGVPDSEGKTEVQKLLELNTDVYRTDQLLAELDDLFAETVQE